MRGLRHRAEASEIPIPLVDLLTQHSLVADEVRRGWERVVSESAFVLGEEVTRFEDDFANFCRVAHCVGVGSGTDALELSVRALGVGVGDEVIVPANSFVASASAVLRAGATPVLVDVDPRTLLIDPALVASSIGPATKAVIAVHLYGQAAPMEQLAELVPEGLALVEDAAQAHGATRGGVCAGGLGSIAGTSFYPSKNLGAYGDGGAVLTNSRELARKVRALGNHGSEVKYVHPELGFNSRLDSLQAVILRAKLIHLAAWNDARREAAARYHRLLEDLEEVQRPMVAPKNEHVWHLYVVRVPNRDRTLERLNLAGIGAGVHYRTPIHLEKGFRDLGYARGDFPVAEAAAQEILSLPMFPQITPEQQARVVDELRKAVR